MLKQPCPSSSSSRLFFFFTFSVKHEKGREGGREEEEEEEEGKLNHYLSFFSLSVQFFTKNKQNALPPSLSYLSLPLSISLLCSSLSKS